MCMYVRTCVRACMRACVRACVCVCVCVFVSESSFFLYQRRKTALLASKEIRVYYDVHPAKVTPNGAGQREIKVSTVHVQWQV